MGNRKETRIVLGTLRYKSAPETTLGIQIPFVQTAKENVEFDRNINISLAQVFDDERQASTTFRPSAKFSMLFKNAYTGNTSYEPFENNLYYVDTSKLAKLQCETSAGSVNWEGFPQYNEFDFIRNDYKVPGYTIPPNNHITFVSKSASTYNWNHFLSYPFSNLYTKNMSYFNSKSQNVINWVSGDGIPFIITNMVEGGNRIVSFKCPVKHGLTIGEYVELSFNYNGDKYFEVYSLGDDTSKSDEYVFNVFDYGFIGSTFNDNVTGTFKRIIDINNPDDTKSEYYVKQLKILTSVDDCSLVKTGFEQNVFGKTKKFESSGFTPNHIERVSLKEGSQSYSLTFNTDIDIAPIRDNQKRPITELYFNVIWSGYFGWTLSNTVGLQQGYDFNLPLVNDKPDPWWDNLNVKSKAGFPLGFYNRVSGTPSKGYSFNYVKSLKKGDILDGGYCEWNSYEQMEREMTPIYHKFKYNLTNFDIRSGPLVNSTNQFGYYYQPNYKITIREYSDYIESGDANNVVDIPDYAHFSTTDDAFIWRDIYSYGYIDTDRIGVDYPFLNGKHYPFQDYIFRIIPEGTNFVSDNIIQDPIIDNCE